MDCDEKIGWSPVVMVEKLAELFRFSTTFILRHFDLKEVARISMAANQRSFADDAVVIIDRAHRSACKDSAEEFTIAPSCGSTVSFEPVCDRRPKSPFPVRFWPDQTIRSVLKSRALLTGGRLAVIWHAPLIQRMTALKRALDIFFAATAIIVFLPLLALAAIAIKLDSPGPVVFRQRRNGLNAKQFVIFKFRTMTVLEDGPAITQAQRGDLRVTRVGRLLRRTSIDELPQLFNVVKGNMSLVGPRPHAVAHDNQYINLIVGYSHRYRVKPGITGWAQVNGSRGQTARLEQMVERVKLDLWYIDHWSFGFDINVLLRTCFEVLRDRAY